MRGLLRDVVLLMCAAAAAYLLTTIATARLALVAATYVQRLNAPWYVALTIAAAFDAAKLVGLLPAAWIVRGAVALRPTLSATILVLFCFGIEVGVMLLLQQAAWSWQRPEVWGTRLAMLLVSIVAVACVIRRGKRSERGPTS